MLRVVSPALAALLFATPALAQQQTPNGLLLLGTASGWGWNCPQQSAVLEEFNLAGLPLTVVTPAQWANEDFDDYTMIFLEDCQDTNTHNAWNSRVGDMQAWVDKGGFLGVHATRNCGSWSVVQPDIPGGTPTMVGDYPSWGDIVDPSHPIAAGVPNPAYGSSHAHDGYPNTGNANDIPLITSQDTGNPVLFLREIGRGAIVYGGLTYSFGQLTCGGGGGQDAGIVLRNEVAWASTFTLCSTIDSDGDGVGDDCDICPFDPLDDKDHDGICDSSDACLQGDNFADTDGDGVPDGCDPCPIDNPDDADGDGVCDSCPDGNHDDDGDGVWACLDNCPYVPNPDQNDDDGDGVGDACDVCPNGDDFNDADGDGFPDGCDNCPYVASDDQSDKDGDGYGTPCDICPAGDDDVDTDGDGVPDACDRCPGFDDAIDLDGDGVPDQCDNCVDIPNASQRDQDGDSYGEACDCDDLDPYTAPNRAEFCDGIDNDCDGEIDENAVDADEYYLDRDQDGFGDPDTAVITCEAPLGYVLKAKDCDDENPGVRPGAVEKCDGIDNDCDGTVDGDHCADPEEPAVTPPPQGGCSTSSTAPTGVLALLLGGLALRRRRD